MQNNYKNIYAVVDEDAIKNNWGRPVDRTDVLYNLMPRKRYKVKEINMGQSRSSFEIEGFDRLKFNTVLFKFFDGDKEIDIFADARFNPYLNAKDHK